MAQEKREAGKTRKVRQKMLDGLGLLALLLLNFAVLAAFGWIVLRNREVAVTERCQGARGAAPGPRQRSMRRVGQVVSRHLPSPG